MKRIYYKDDYKNMAVDLLCIAGKTKVIRTLGSFRQIKSLVDTAAILTIIGNNIDPEPLIVEDSDYKEAVYSKH